MPRIGLEFSAFRSLSTEALIPNCPAVNKNRFSVGTPVCLIPPNTMLRIRAFHDLKFQDHLHTFLKSSSKSFEDQLSAGSSEIHIQDSQEKISHVFIRHLLREDDPAVPYSAQDALLYSHPQCKIILI